MHASPTSTSSDEWWTRRETSPVAILLKLAFDEEFGSLKWGESRDASRQVFLDALTGEVHKMVKFHDDVCRGSPPVPPALSFAVWKSFFAHVRPADAKSMAELFALVWPCSLLHPLDATQLAPIPPLDSDRHSSVVVTFNQILDYVQEQILDLVARQGFILDISRADKSLAKKLVILILSHNEGFRSAALRANLKNDSGLLSDDGHGHCLALLRAYSEQAMLGLIYITDQFLEAHLAQKSSTPALSHSVILAIETTTSTLCDKRTGLLRFAYPLKECPDPAQVMELTEKLVQCSEILANNFYRWNNSSSWSVRCESSVEKLVNDWTTIRSPMSYTRMPDQKDAEMRSEALLQRLKDAQNTLRSNRPSGSSCSGR